MAMPITGLVPNGLQWAGVALASGGLILSMAFPGQRTPVPVTAAARP
jgi:hypothetical protein